MVHERAVGIELLEPVISSLAVATAADPDALPYIPGAMLWGLVVGNAYRRKDDARDILQRYFGGDLTFDDALPVAIGSVGLPAPKSLHEPKTDRGKWQDWSDGTHRAGFAQAKSGCIGSGMQKVEVRLRTSMRTAIDPKTGMAADGQFFGLTALEQGQRFVARISGADANLVDETVKALVGVQRLGRSRNAEFGRVRIAFAQVPDFPSPAPGDAVHLWCLSDLAAHDDDFQPSERPGERMFGAAIDWSRSFVRHRSYSPFNAHWQARAPERQVIARGSVIVLRKPIRSGLHRFGFHTEQGLGLVIASSEKPLDLLNGWSSSATGAFVGDSRDPSEERAKAELTPLAEWLSTRAVARGLSAEVKTEATQGWDAWRKHYEAAKALAGRRVGPTPTQWGRIASAGNDVLPDLLRDLSEEGLRREIAAWQARFAPGPSGTFIAALQDVLGNDNAGPERVRRLAQALRRELADKGWFDA